MMKRNKFVAATVASLVAVSTVAVAAPTQAAETNTAVTTSTSVVAFPDVPTTHGHYETITELAQRGIVKGFPDGTFKPGQSVTRGQAAKMIAGILGLDTKNVQNPNFTDIKTDFQYYGAIAALVDEGIIGGYEDNTYRPDATLTRGHMAKILQRAFKLTADDEVSPFTDIALSEYKNDIEALYDNGVTVGTTPTTYSPRANVTRAQLSSFIIRAEDAVAFELVEVSGTIAAIFEGVITIDGIEYRADEQLAKLFGTDNAPALLGAEVVLTVQKSKDGNVIKAVKSLKLKAPNTTFDGDGLHIPNLEVAANGVTVKNVKTDELKVADNVKANIADSEIGNLVLGINAQAAFSGNNRVDKITLPKGVTPGSVVTGLPNLNTIPTEEYGDGPPTPPTPPGGGGGGGGVIVPTNYEPALESILGTVSATAGFETYADIVAKYATVTPVLGSTTDGGGKVTIDVNDKAATAYELQESLKGEQGSGALTFIKNVSYTTPQLTALTALRTIEITSTDFDTQTITVNASASLDQTIEALINDANEARKEIAADVTDGTLAKDLADVTVKLTFSNNTALTYTIDVQ